MDVTALVRKLRDGQKELKSNMRTLTSRDGARQKNCKGKERARKLYCSPDQHQKPTKRARIVQLSPQQRPHPRRLSSTPKGADNVPSLDLSLENALGTDKNGCRDSRVHFAEDSDHPSTSSQHHSFLSSQQAGGDSRIKGTGTNVSFTCGPASTTSRAHTRHAPQDLGAKLVESLNASRFGALQSRASKGYPRQYKGDDPRLGYDWIAGMLDTQASVSEKDEKYFVGIREFRRVNRSECCQPPDATLLPPGHDDLPATGPLDSSSTQPTTPPAVTTCVSSYVLNDRLFPIPVHHHSEPGILCPVCEGSHDMDGAESVGVASTRYIKVSIPRCTLEPVSRLRARRKREGPSGRGSRPSGRSPVSTESMGLSKHCQAGWETAQPAMVAPQPSISLRSCEHSSEGNVRCPSDHTHEVLSSQGLLNTSHSLQYNQLARGHVVM